MRKVVNIYKIIENSAGTDRESIKLLIKAVNRRDYFAYVVNLT